MAQLNGLRYQANQSMEAKGWPSGERGITGRGHMSELVAVVAMSAIYPSGIGVEALWQSAVERQRCFRDIPNTRLPLDEYAATALEEDSVGVRSAGLIDGWSFDLQRYRIPRDLYAATDTTHWLALDACNRLLADLGQHPADPDRIGVIIGNSLTGEISRANSIRLRWPYIQRVVQSVSDSTGLSLPEGWMEQLEERFKEPFPVPGTDTLAGGLSNTIAGRLTNYFDFHGLGYTVDGACASSLLSVMHAQSLLRDRSLDLAIAGGVDMSIDPFEMVGFSRLGALAGDAMRIYDKRPTGFFPGEGCGLVALMRLEDAHKADIPVLAVLAGSGVSSDGAGGLTRPAEAGHRLAAARAYKQADVHPDEIGLFEGHGTGTAVGDAAELNVFSQLRDGGAESAAVGSIKANIGHTKAAAGVAGLIKAVSAVSRGIIPPTSGVDQPHDLFEQVANLRIAHEPEEWNSSKRVAAVSALGFGGVNTHVVVANDPATVRKPSRPPARWRSGEFGLLVITGDTTYAVRDDLVSLKDATALFSDADCVAAAQSATHHANPRARVRVALVVRGRSTLRQGMATAIERLEAIATATRHFHCDGDLAIGIGTAGSFAALFPGQGAPFRRQGPAVIEALDHRSAWCEAANTAWSGLESVAGSGTDVAQPAIIAAEMVGISWLEAIGARPSVAVGHSLGELAALAWAEMLSPTEVVKLAAARGTAMQEKGMPGTGMIAIDTDPDSAMLLVEQALGGAGDCELSAYNGPSQSVIGGPAEQLDQLAEFARRQQVLTHRLQVSHAFHTRAMEPAVPDFTHAIAQVGWRAANPERRVYSTVSGKAVSTPEDVTALLRAQLTNPVRLTQALQTVAKEVDLLVEIGPGRTLSAAAKHFVDQPVVAMDVHAGVSGIGRASAALVALGVVENLDAWTRVGSRTERTFDYVPKLLAAPMGKSGTSTAQAPARNGSIDTYEAPTSPAKRTDVHALPEASDFGSAPGEGSKSGHSSVDAALETDVSVGARESRGAVSMVLVSALENLTGLAAENLDEEARLSADLHLNSLQINHLFAEVAAQIGRQVPSDPTGLADGTIGDALDLMVELPESDAADGSGLLAAPWLHTFVDSWAPEADASLLEETAWSQSTVHGFDTEPTATHVHIVLPETVSADDVLRMRDVVSLGWNRVVVDHAGAGSAAARVLFHEMPQSARGWALIQRPSGSDEVDQAVLDRLPAGEFKDLKIDAGGQIHGRQAGRAAANDDAFHFSGADPLVLVTGGLKGITAECAAELAERTGARLLFVGRTPREDRSVAGALDGLATRGIEASYRALDLTQRGEAAQVLADVAGDLRGILHGAAINVPKRGDQVTAAELDAVSEVKIEGFCTLMEMVDSSQLELVVTFGSIIERSGLAGQLSYAHANEGLRVSTENLAMQLPAKVIHLQWSIWSDVGMGQDLGVLDAMRRRGVIPVSPEAGRQSFWREVNRDASVTRLVMGRYPQQPTLEFPSIPQKRALRYLEEVILHTPETEMTVSGELSAPTDRALQDHQIAEVSVMPVVCALEAAAQAAATLKPERSWLRFRNLEILKPVSLSSTAERTRLMVNVADDGTPGVLSIKIADDKGDVAIMEAHSGAPCETTWQRGNFAGVGSELYGPLYFHRGAFQRVERLGEVTASNLRAQLVTDPGTWFSPFLPQGLLLGDVGVLDSTIHAIQACFPQRQLLPVGADEVTVHKPVPEGPCELSAHELSPLKDNLRFDVVLEDRHGEPVISWCGLQLRESHALNGIAALELVGPAIARHVRGLGWSADLDAVVTSDSEPSETVLRQLTGRQVGHDSAGRLWCQPGYASTSVSAGHRLTAWSADHRIGIDWEVEAAQLPRLPSDYDHLLVALGERLPDSIAALALWAALEAAKKTQLSYHGLSVTNTEHLEGVGVGITLVNTELRIKVLVLTVADQQVVVAIGVSK